MFLEIWDCIKNYQLEEASQKLKDFSNISDEYLLNVAKLLESEVALRQEKYQKCLELANITSKYFSPRIPHLDELKQNPTGIGINFLENCWNLWIFSRALAGDNRLLESFDSAERALKHWEIYSVSRVPFLEIKPDVAFRDLPNHLKMHLRLLRSRLGKKPPKQEILDLLVPDHFQPKPFATKVNNLPKSNLLISVCISSYMDGPWLKRTVDAVIANAGFDNYEIVLLYQKQSPADPIDEFLLSEPYKSNPKLKIHIYDFPLGADNSKQICYEMSHGEIIISLDAHVIPCHDFIKKSVELFLKYPEVSLLNFGVVETGDNELLKYFSFNEVPIHLSAVIGHAPVDFPQNETYYKPGLYIRQCLSGGGFCITRQLLNEIGGYLLRNHSWGDKSLGINAYLYGYYIYSSPDLIYIHKWHTILTEIWRDRTRKTTYFEYTNDAPSSALVVGYFYFSQEYFEKYFIPWIQEMCSLEFEFHWEKFQKELPAISLQKEVFWQNAVRSVREYWLEYFDYVWSKLNVKQKEILTRDFEP